MARDVTDQTPIESRAELIDWFEAGNKPRQDFRLGTEHEKFVFYRDDFSPVPYEGRPRRDQGGIEALLEGMRGQSGWEEVTDRDRLIGLFDPKGGGAISLEPGGQFELSGAPVATLHETAAELAEHMRIVKAIAEPHDIGFLGLGMTPDWRRDEMPVMPKGRYAIMANYMPKVGRCGLDMMFRTSTVQVNLDFAGEADMVRKLRVSLALQPVATALFANSPFTDGKLNGFLSARSEIWRDTDNRRAGMMPFAFESGMGFERYADYALDVPMYFVKRGEIYHDVTGASFRDLMAGKLAQLPGERATISDWANHLSTIFTEVRLKRYLEMRGADVGNIDHMLALSALFTGLLYDDAAVAAGIELTAKWSAEERQRLRDEVPKLGLATPFRRHKLNDIARDMLIIAREGLTARNKRDGQGRDETTYLNILDERIASGRVAAQDLIDKFNGPWSKSVRPAYTELAL